MHGTPAVSLKVLTVQRRTDLDWDYANLRAPYWRFYWNFSGSAQITLAGRAVVLEPETAYLIAPDTQFAAHGSGIDHFFVHFTLPDDVRMQDGGVYRVAGSQELGVLVTHLAGDGDGNRDAEAVRATRAQTNLLAAGVVLCALSRIPPGARSVPIADPVVRAAVAAISSDPGRFVRSEQVAQQAGCDERTLRRRFRSVMQTTPVQFAMRRRIEHSCMLLHFTERSIDEIAELTGFCDRHHFTKVFQAHRGIGPAGFRSISDQLPKQANGSQ